MHADRGAATGRGAATACERELMVGGGPADRHGGGCQQMLTPHSSWSLWCSIYRPYSRNPGGQAAGVARRGDEIVVIRCGRGVLGPGAGGEEWPQPRNCSARQATADHLTGRVG